MTHHSCIGWVQVDGVWALCVLHFHVCPKLVCCSCVCHGLDVCLRVLLLILDLLWRELFYDPPFFMVASSKGWALLDCGLFFLLAHCLFLPLAWQYSCHAILLFLLWRYLIYVCWVSFRPTVYSFLNWLQWPSMVIGFILMLLWAFLTHYIACGLAHFFLLGHPWPICFPWASSAHFLILYSHGFLLTLLGFSNPITISFILGIHGFSINPLLS